MSSLLTTLLVHLSNAKEELPPGSYLCPGGVVVPNIHLEFVHIQDFSGSYKTKGPEMANQLQELADDMSDRFGGMATFSLMEAIDKKIDAASKGSFSGSPNNKLECSKYIADGVKNDGTWGASLGALSIEKNFIGNYARPDLLDAAYEQINQWAADGPAFNPDTGLTHLRILSLGTDQCPRESGQDYRFTDEFKQYLADEGRGLHFPLSGAPLTRTCDETDYPSFEEIAGEARRNSVAITTMISGVKNHGKYDVCQDFDKISDDAAGKLNDDGSKMRIDEWWMEYAEDIMIRHGVTSAQSINAWNDGIGDMADILGGNIEEVICSATTQEPEPTDPPTTTTTTTTMAPTTAVTTSIDVPMTNPTQGPGLQIYCDNPAFSCSEYTDLPVDCLDKTTYINCSNTCATYAPDEFLNDKDIIDIITEADFCYIVPTDPTPIPTDAPIVPTDAPVVPTEDLGIDNGMITADLPSCECDCDGDCDCDSACDCQKEVVDGAADIAIVGIDQMADTINHVIEFIAVQAASEHEAKMNEGFTE